MSSPIISVIIPALNEENGVTKVINSLPTALINEIIVVDNGSVDHTSQKAKKAGATVLIEKKRGYGNACLKAILYLKKSIPKPDIVVFIDSDFSDYPEQIEKLIEPIIHHNFDFVVGSRSMGIAEKGSRTLLQIFGNWMATLMLKILYNGKYSDLGPFRAIKFDKLLSLQMKDRNYGWTVEMQAKAIKKKLKYTEVPVDYRKRIGTSKVSGTISGSIKAGSKIIWTILKLS